jgi:hypothetical protein
VVDQVRIAVERQKQTRRPDRADQHPLGKQPASGRNQRQREHAGQRLYPRCCPNEHWVIGDRTPLNIRGNRLNTQLATERSVTTDFGKGDRPDGDP